MVDRDLPQAMLLDLDDTILSYSAHAEPCWLSAFVGDNLEWEVAVPQKLGLYAVWHDPTGQGLPPDSTIQPDRTIYSLSELLNQNT
jgi:hypothetical protein